MDAREKLIEIIQRDANNMTWPQLADAILASGEWTPHEPKPDEVEKLAKEIASAAGTDWDNLQPDGDGRRNARAVARHVRRLLRDAKLEENPVCEDQCVCEACLNSRKRRSAILAEFADVTDEPCVPKGAAGTAKLRDHGDAANARKPPLDHYESQDSRTGRSEWVDAPLDAHGSAPVDPVEEEAKRLWTMDAFEVGNTSANWAAVLPSSRDGYMALARESLARQVGAYKRGVRDRCQLLQCECRGAWCSVLTHGGGRCADLHKNAADLYGVPECPQ